MPSLAAQSLADLLSRAERYVNPAAKSIRGYVDDYLVALTGLIADVINGDSDWATMARLHRGLLTQYAADTYREGMWESGEYKTRAEVDENYEADDEETVAAWIAEQRGYVREFAKAVGDVLKVADDPAKFKTAQQAINDRAQMWADSLRSLGDLGKASAKSNQMLTWRLGKTEEHCNTCATLDGQSHRLKWYTARDYLPRKNGAAMDCGGWKCDCGLFDKDGKRVM